MFSPNVVISAEPNNGHMMATKRTAPVQRTIANRLSKFSIKDRKPDATPADNTSDVDLELELGAQLRECWRETEPLNANRVWRTVVEQIDEDAATEKLVNVLEAA